MLKHSTLGFLYPLPVHDPRALVGRVADQFAYAAAIRMAAVLFGVCLTAAAAQISVPLPFTPVPLTLQPMVVLLCGAALGSRLGATSQVLYLVIGVAGLPVFAASPLLAPGVGRLLGPTGGYLLSYPFAALLVGWLIERGFDRRYGTSVLAMLAGLAVIFLGGASWLMRLPPSAAGFTTALKIGVYPFVLAGLLKVFVAAACLPRLRRLASDPEGDRR